MDNFKRGGFRGGGDRGGFKGGSRGGFGGGRSERGGDRDSRGPVTMHSAVCSSCGKTCEVPFRPTGEKPVYCRDCFAGRSAMGGERSQRKDPRTFSPNAPYNSQSNSSSQNAGNGELKKQIEAMNVKLDKLISAVQEITLKGALKEVTTESKDTPKITAPTKIEVKMKKTTKKK